MAGRVRDLICGMEFDKDTASGSLEYKGKTYYFCSFIFSIIPNKINAVDSRKGRSMEITRKILLILIGGFTKLSLGCGDYHESKTLKADAEERSFSSNGEKIYFTGTSMKGIPISSERMMTLSTFHVDI